MKPAIDWDHAETAAARIVLAYEIGDAMAEYAGEFSELQAAAVTILQIVAVFNLVHMGVTEKQATAEYARAFRLIKKHIKRLGDGARLADVLAELHLK